MLARIGSASVLVALLASPYAIAQEPIDCVRQGTEEGRRSFDEAQSCAVFDDSGSLRPTAQFLESTYFDEDGLSCVLFHELGFFWVRSDGRTASVPTWDNMCAWFSEGLTVANIDEHEVYIDQEFQVVLDPGYEVLAPFEDGYARVCNGPFIFDQRRENRRTGGQCGLIDRSGQLVLDLLYPVEDFTSLREYRNANSRSAQ